MPSDVEKMAILYEVVWPDVDYDKLTKADFVITHSNGINYCAEYKDEIVGSRTSIFENMYIGNRCLNCVQCGDSCVHPSFQGKGIFQRMNKAFLKGFFEEQPGQIVYNISVEASRRSYEKLGWQYIESMMKLRCFPFPLRTIKKIGLRLKEFRRPIFWNRTNNIFSIDERLLAIRENHLIKDNLLHIRYDRETFEWRVKSNSGIKSFFDSKYGYILYKEGTRGVLKEIEIGEVFLYEYSKRAFRNIIKLFNKTMKPDIVWVMVSEGHPLRKWYSSLFFLPNPKQKYLHHGVKIMTQEMEKICYNPQNWAISSLDIDTF